MRILLGLMAFLFLVVAVVIIAPSFIDWSSYRAQVQQLAEDNTGYKLTIDGDLSFSVLPLPHLYVSDVVLVNPGFEQEKPVASLDRLDVYVDPLPLLSGEIRVQSVEMIRPDIYIARRDSRFSWQNDHIDNALSGKAAPESAQAPAFSIDNLYIEDGRLTFQPEEGGKINVRDANLSVSAVSLSGPFEVEGRLTAQNQPVEMDIRIGSISENAQSVTAEGQLSLADRGIGIRYDGVIETGESPGGQGRVSVNLQNPGTLLRQAGMDINGQTDPWSVEGLVTFNAARADVRDLRAVTHVNTFNGTLALAYDPLFVELDLATQDVIDPQSYGLDLSANGSSDPVFDPENIRPAMFMLWPATLNLPTVVNGEARISAGGLIFKDAVFRDPKLGLRKDQSEFQLNASVASLPGGGAARILSTAIYGAQSRAGEPESGWVFSDPEGRTDLSFSVSNIGETARALDIDLPIDSDTVALTASLAMAASPTKIEVEPSTLQLGDIRLNYAGSLSRQRDSDLPALEATFWADQAAVADLMALGGRQGNLTLSPQLQKADIRGRFTGSIGERLDANINIEAGGASLIAEGRVDPFDGFGLSDTALQIKHDRTADILKLAGMQAPAFTSFQEPLDIYAKVTTSGDGVMDLAGITGNLAGTSVTGALNVSAADNPLTVQGALEFGDVSLVSVARTANTGGAPEWPATPVDLSALADLSANVDLKANTLNYEGWAFARPSFGLAVDNGALRINDFTGGLYGGEAELALTLEAAGNTGGTLALQGTMSNVSLEEVIRDLAGAYILRGEGNATLKADINTAGTSVRDWIGALQGRGEISGQDIILSGFDLTQFAEALSSETKPGDTVKGLWRSAGRGGSTAFETLDGEFSIDTGIVNLQDISLDGEQAQIVTNGQADLPRWTLDTAHTVTLKQRQDVPEFTINIEGPIDNPGQTIGGGVLQDYLQRKVQRKVQEVIQDKVGGQLGEVLGGLTGGPAPGSPEPAANDNRQPVESGADQGADSGQIEPQPRNLQPEDAIRGVLEGILKR